MKNIFFGVLTVLFIFGGISLFFGGVVCGDCHSSVIFENNLAGGFAVLIAGFGSGLIALKGLS